MKLGQVALHVKDLPQATAFYRDVLGLRFLFEAPGLAFFDMGGVRLMLSAVAEGEQHESVLYYQVDDLDATFRDLVSRGATVESEPHLIARMPDHELWMGFVRDSDRRLVGIMTEIRNADPLPS